MRDWCFPSPGLGASKEFHGLYLLVVLYLSESESPRQSSGAEDVSCRTAVTFSCHLHMQDKVNIPVTLLDEVLHALLTRAESGLPPLVLNTHGRGYLNS